MPKTASTQIAVIGIDIGKYLPLLVTLADDADRSIDAVDRRDFERRSFADAKAARIH